MRHVVPCRPEAESSKLRSASKNSLQEKSGGIMPEKPAG
ncbi:phosphoenolpyruvate carboxykinase [Pseudomonas aeruginosa]|nr:phosphoenolpyruvate carboxykinase [Pseudomonas aeruginosa]